MQRRAKISKLAKQPCAFVHVAVLKCTHSDYSLRNDDKWVWKRRYIAAWVSGRWRLQRLGSCFESADRSSSDKQGYGMAACDHFFHIKNTVSAMARPICSFVCASVGTNWTERTFDHQELWRNVLLVLSTPWLCDVNQQLEACVCNNLHNLRDLQECAPARITDSAEH